MRISIAMYTCDQEAHVLEQLRSIAHQTHRPDELIVCDDHSRDHTADIVGEFASTCPFPVRLLINPLKQGPSFSFGHMLEECEGDLIFLADRHQIWAPEKLAVMHSLFERYEQIGLAFSDALVVDEWLRPLGYRLWEAMRFDEQEQQQFRTGQALRVLLRHNVISAGTMAFRASFRELCLPIPNLPSAHDAWIALLLTAASEVAIIPTPMVHHMIQAPNQPGILKDSLGEQIQTARRQIESRAFRCAMDLSLAGSQRLHFWAQAGHPINPDALRLLKGKVLHSRVRDSMARWLPLRLHHMLRECLTGRYFRYAYGFKSIAQDLWLR